MLRRSFLSVLPAISLFGLNKQNLWPEFIVDGYYLCRRKNDHRYRLFNKEKTSSQRPGGTDLVIALDRPRKCVDDWYQEIDINMYGDSTPVIYSSIGELINMKVFNLQDLLDPGTMIDRAGNIYHE